MGLREKYSNEKINWDCLTEKNIIYFCRDALSSFVKSEKLKSGYENEILNMIKKKGLDNLDIHKTDIDDNNLLLYPVYNGAFKIVDFLLKSGKYDLTVYNKGVSKALTACVHLNGEKMLDYLLSYTLNNEYVVDMMDQAIYYTVAVENAKSKLFYSEIFKRLMLRVDGSEEGFLKIATNFFHSGSDLNKTKEAIIFFMENYSFDVEKKILLIDTLIEEKHKERFKFYAFFEKAQVFEQFKIKHVLEKEILDPSKVKSLKI